MMLNHLFNIVCVVGLTLSATAQNSAVSGVSDEGGANLSRTGSSLIPPSPEAFNFTKYGNLPVGLFTGTAQFSIPIYTIKSGSIGHAVTLEYATNGIKVDEVASRVGMGWTLRVGGMITRTVQGLPDEFSSRTYFHRAPYPGDSSEYDNDFWNYIRQASYATPPDFQPDDYSFNVDGFSGKFIRSEDGNYKSLSPTAVKIEASTNGFILTAGNGNKYFFYKKELTKSITQVEPIAPMHQPGFTTTAWFLTKIISPTKDSVVFNYQELEYVLTQGYSEEYSLELAPDFNYRLLRFNDWALPLAEPIGPSCLDPECIYSSYNIQRTHYQTHYLTSIDFDGGSLQLATSVRADAHNERKVDSINVLRSVDQARIKSFALTYNYAVTTTVAPPMDTMAISKRLYLSRFSEFSRDLVSSSSFAFDYDDYNGLPQRTSKSQDHFGFYNGKTNEYFVPNDTWLRQYIGDFGGDRRFDFNYAKKGVLRRVAYPTGGYSEFSYEPHRVQDNTLYQTTYDSLHSTITSAAIDTSTFMNIHQEVPIDTFYAKACRQVSVKVNCNWASTPSPYFPESYYAYINLVHKPSNTVVGYMSVVPGEEKTYTVPSNLTEGDLYGISLYASNDQLKIDASMLKIPFWRDTIQNGPVAGIRVKAVADFASDGEENNRREFLYGDWDDSTSCSGMGIVVDYFQQYYVSVARRFASKTRLTTAPAGNKIYAGNTVLHSNSVRSVYLNESNAVVYDKVIELNRSSTGAQLGGTEHEFFFARKTIARPLNEFYPLRVWHYSPFMLDGSPFSNDDFRNGLTKSSTAFTYSQFRGERTPVRSTRNYFSVDAGTFSVDTFYAVRQALKRTSYTIGWKYFADYDIGRYFRHRVWVKLDSAITMNYSGPDSLRTKVAYTYSATNYKVASETHFTSGGADRQVFYRYPQNITSSEPGYAAYQSMALNNLVDPVVDQSMVRNATSTRQKTYYGEVSLPGYAAYLPESVQSQSNSNPPETEIAFEQYGRKGNPVQYRGKDGIITSIVWGYDHTYPVAKIAGAAYNTASSLLDTNLLNHPSSDHALRTHLNGLRNGLAGTVLVTTFTHAPLVGMTSQTDPAGRTVFYEYDHFNRLSVIRDQDSIILKKYCYKYADEPGDCNGARLYENRALSQSFVRNNCSAGLYGTVVTYLVSPGKYVSPISQAYVDSLSHAEVNAYGQSNANQFGSCAVCNTATNCVGADKKCINGVCEAGEKICTSTVRVNGVWYTTFHYEWSDNSTSQDYTEQGLGCFSFE